MNKVIGLLLVIAIVIGVGPYARSLSAPLIAIPIIGAASACGEPAHIRTR